MAIVYMLMLLGLSATARGEDDGATRGAAVPADVGTPLLDDDVWASPDVAAPAMDPRPLARDNGRGTWASSDADDSARTSAAWLRTTLALGGVVGLIGLLAWGYRRVAAGGSLGFTLRPPRGTLIEVVGRATLAPRQTVCLVRVGPRLVLLGCSADAVRTLDVIDDPDLTARLLGEAQRASNDSNSAVFAQCLDRESRAYPPDEELPDEDELAPEAQRLESVQDTLQRMVTRLRNTATAG